RYALWNETGADGHRSDRSLTIVLMHKEFRLQKNNLLLTVGTLILSVFAIVTTYLFDFSYTGFDSPGVRSAFISCLIIPALVFVLPAMIGSTAAAAERAMDVWRWQGALPVSWRQVMAAKIAVMALLVLGISGVLTYLTHLVSVEPSTGVWNFRATATYARSLLWCSNDCYA